MIKFDKAAFDKYGFKCPTTKQFIDNGLAFQVKEIILTDITGPWHGVAANSVLGLVVIADDRTTTVESCFWSMDTGNCGNHHYRLIKESE